ncbi:hypothetical protein SprV_0100391500 [Sparganum proliferum]
MDMYVSRLPTEQHPAAQKGPIGTFPRPGGRLSRVHLDIVAPLAQSTDCFYLLTCVDRFTWRSETIPLPDIQASAVVKAFLSCTRIRTTAYRLAGNGMVEPSNRQLKTSVGAAEDLENWKDHLPLVLLGIRSTLKSDLKCSTAEPVFGVTVKLPGEMVSPSP